MLDTVIIANSHEKDGNKVDIKCKMEILMVFMMKLTIWDFKTLALISGKILFTQLLKLHEKLFTQPFYVRKFLSPNSSVNNERSLTDIKFEMDLRVQEVHAACRHGASIVTSLPNGGPE